MRPLVIVCFLAVSGLSVPVTPTHATESRIHLTGHFWAEGGFPPTLSGGELQAVGVVNSIVAPLFWSPDRFSYTWHMHDLLAASVSQWGATHTVEYGGGQITIYVDDLPSNHDYGTFPTNATVPSTFTDGSHAYLTGRILWAALTYTTSTQSGSFLAEIQFTDGAAYPQLESTESWTLGSYIYGTSPAGYAGQLNGDMYVDGPTARGTRSWAAVKSLYR